MTDKKIVLITPTGARPKQIETCAALMKKQTYAGPVIWIIVDDCDPATAVFIDGSFRDGWDIWKIYPNPSWRPGQNTQGRNLKCAIDCLQQHFVRDEIGGIFFIEDDDYYSDTYLERMVPMLDGFDVIGETHTIYYNIAIRKWIMNHNAEWSSLFQTAMTFNAIPAFERLYGEKFIDYMLFKQPDVRVNLFRAGNISIGIKGQPGRSGIGAGHGWIRTMVDDPKLDQLRKFIGDDVKFYM
jgi:hypothetical protein